MSHCQECKFFEPSDEKKYDGECHKNPPQAIVSRDNRTGEESFLGVFPEVDGGNWCGAFEPEDQA